MHSRSLLFVDYPHARIHFSLQEKYRSMWGDKVTLLFGDMRSLPVPIGECKAHIIVSELLGSFGDNELSPECLDGAMRFLARECNLIVLTRSINQVNSRRDIDPKFLHLLSRSAYFNEIVQ
jgi:hypothetical protein